MPRDAHVCQDGKVVRFIQNTAKFKLLQSLGSRLGYTMTTYPFALPDVLRQRLPSPSRDGNHYLDVRVGRKWDGILVVDAAGLCIGIYVRNRVEEHPLPFAAEEIEDVRRASLGNRLLALLPVDLWDAALLTILVVSPIALFLGYLVSPLFALVSVFACVWAIHIMYQSPGFPFIRLPVANLGLMQIVSGGWLLLRWLF